MSKFIESGDYEGFLNHTKLNGLDISNDTLLNLAIDEYFRLINIDKNEFNYSSDLVDIDYEINNIKLIIEHILSYYQSAYPPSDTIKNKLLDFDREVNEYGIYDFIIDMNLLYLFINKFPLWLNKDKDLLQISKMYIENYNDENYKDIMDKIYKYLLDNLNPNSKSEEVKKNVNILFDIFLEFIFDNNDNKYIVNLTSLIDRFNEIILFDQLIHYYDYITYYDEDGKLLYKIFESILGKNPEIFFNIIEKTPIYAIQLAKIASSDLDYVPYIEKYLKMLIKYKLDRDDKYNKLKLKIFNTLSHGDYDRGDEDVDLKYYYIIKDNLVEEAYYYLGHLLFQKSNLTNEERKEMIGYLLKSNDEGKKLALKIIQDKYLHLPFGTQSHYSDNVDILVNLLDYIK